MFIKNEKKIWITKIKKEKRFGSERSVISGWLTYLKFAAQNVKYNGNKVSEKSDENSSVSKLSEDIIN